MKLNKIKCSFLKKKSLYIVLTVIFSLILVADIAVAVFVPDMPVGRGNMKGFDMGEMPEGFDMGEMPEGFDMGEMPEDFDMGEMPEGFDMSELPEGTPNTGGGFLQVWKSNWLVIFIIFFLLDAFSIFMLARISLKKKNKSDLNQLEDTRKAVAISEKESNEIKIKKSIKKKKHAHYIWIILLAGMIIMILVVKVLKDQSGAEEDQTEATVYTETVETGNIDSIVPGTGTLSEEEAELLVLPSNIEITKLYVDNGDAVKQGDKLADVDTVSVMTAIVNVQEKLASIDEALEEHENDQIEDTVTATAAGRVKKIYAKAGTAVVDTMYKSEALMLISLDGKMAVSLETEAEISAGDSVNVYLTDGSKVSGKVESKTKGVAVITVSDENADYEEEVTVKTDDDKTIGTGTLYIHSELKVTGFTGNVSSVNVSVDQKVSAGATLLTLTDTDYSGEYEMLLEKRAVLEEQIQELFQIYQNKCIYASCDGVISGVDEDAIGVKSVGAYVVEKLSAIFTSEASDTDESGDSDNVGDTDESEDQDDAGNSENQGGSGDLDDGEKPDDTGNLDDSDKPDDNDADSDTSETYLNYIGVVTSTENGVATVKCLPNAVTEIGSYNEIKEKESQMTEEKQISLSSISFVYKYENGRWITNGRISAGEYIVMTYSPVSNSVVLVLCVTESSGDLSQDMPEMNGDSEQMEAGAGAVGDTSMSMSGMSGLGSMDEVTATVTQMQENEIEEEYSVDVTTWMSIIPQNYMEITITVDELDILSLEKGQKAEVTLNAFPGQSFEGTVKSINVAGTNAGGSTKYTAVVQIPREENMLSSMNASVKITIATKENILTIPVNALVEQDGGTYVYTSYDEKSDTLGNLVEITTGVSDGDRVEVLSGLEEGSEYSYSCLDVVNYNSSFIPSGGFSFGAMRD